jgi:aromatic ring-cleaving dioxygenase
MKTLILPVLLVACFEAHYHIHDWNSLKNSGLAVDSGKNRSCEYATTYSYHIHVLFWQNNPTHTASAMALRDEFIEKFNLVHKNCTISAGDPAPGHAMCVFEVDWNPAGPFTTAQYSFFIPPKELQETSSWMLQHRGIHDVYIHPNTGCETDDHTKWYTFSGDKWPIDASIFTCDYPGCKPSLQKF